MSETPRPGDDDEGIDEMANLSGLYALDALDVELSRRFEAYLATHPEARAEVEEFRATAAILSELATVAPPAGLRDRVVAQVAATRQDPPVVASITERARRGRTWVAVAAVVLLVAAIGAVVYRATSESDTPPSQLAELLGRPDARVVRLTGDPAEGAKVVWSRAAGRAVLVAAQVDPLADATTYELWQLRGGTATSVGLFRPDRQGRVQASFVVDLVGADGLGVTVEPSGGSATPTLPVVLSGAVS